MLREIRSFGYEVGYSILGDFRCLIRPAAQLRIKRRIETTPGRQVQVDFAMFKIAFNNVTLHLPVTVVDTHYL
ncbi:MAG: hypothetical protein F4082_07485 [Gammaproteobacteria bacterium]|nr:hypothetical protein [Gammaproteobacteria bacterium]